MTELNLDNYINKLNEIKLASENYNTVKTDLQALISELLVLDDAIDNNATMPLNIGHLNKLILVSIIRVRKSELQGYLYNLIECRNAHLFDVYQTDTAPYEERNAYALASKDIKNYIEDEIIENCNCMKGRYKTTRNIVYNSKK